VCYNLRCVSSCEFLTVNMRARECVRACVCVCDSGCASVGVTAWAQV